ncbi:hypothetical protein [Maribacter sp. ACAM166]|uniref:hypothetical protein n=1 Tax=Maribacter sp. ACAM166 TaxID=2508996 RepID=UPI0010FE17D4|nr:hypothetical protein [Maribacter sp. ACAM166]TLP80905.1 hypothetical protein ES765_05510 [Maribacter sp. ACAM166]
MRILQILILFISLNLFSQNKIENLKVNWPEEYEWEIVSNQENEQMHFIELVPKKESIDNWKILGTMISIKGAKNIPIDTYINLTYKQTKQTAPKAVLTVIEKNKTDKNHWALFQIESPRFTNDNNPESQLYYIIQGNSSLYSNFVAVKNKKLSNEFVEKWIKIFKSSELVYQ